MYVISRYVYMYVCVYIYINPAMLVQVLEFNKQGE